LYIFVIACILAQTLFEKLTILRKPNASEDLLSRILTAFVTTPFPMTCFYVFVNCKNTIDIVSYVHGLFQQSLDKPSKITGHWQLLNMIFAWLLYVSLRLTPTLFVFGFHWNNPCKNTLFGWWMIPECYSKWKEFEQISVVVYAFMKVVKLGVLSLNHLILSKGYSAVAFGVGGLNILCILKFRQLLNA